jgi:hypothetical protein
MSRTSELDSQRISAFYHIPALRREELLQKRRARWMMKAICLLLVGVEEVVI